MSMFKVLPQGIVAGICVGVILVISFIVGCVIYWRMSKNPPKRPFWTVELKNDHEGVNFNTVPNEDFQVCVCVCVSMCCVCVVCVLCVFCVCCVCLCVFCVLSVCSFDFKIREGSSKLVQNSKVRWRLLSCLVWMILLVVSKKSQDKFLVCIFMSHGK